MEENGNRSNSPYPSCGPLAALVASDHGSFVACESTVCIAAVGSPSSTLVVVSLPAATAIGSAIVFSATDQWIRPTTTLRVCTVSLALIMMGQKCLLRQSQSGCD